MKTIGLTNLGRFGNQLFRYAYARALSEQTGHMLRTERWVGEKIFTLDNPPNLIPYPAPDGTEDIVIDGYHQNQSSLIYSRADCRRWFKLRPEVEAVLRNSDHDFQPCPLAHIRRGDYAGSSYPMIGPASIQRAMKQYGLDKELGWVEVSDANPSHPVFGWEETPFVADFYRMMCARVLFRANSSFSYWASVLGHGTTYSPIITGLAGGVEHNEVEFVEGNWPALAELPNITHLHLSE